MTIVKTLPVDTATCERLIGHCWDVPRGTEPTALKRPEAGDVRKCRHCGLEQIWIVTSRWENRS